MTKNTDKLIPPSLTNNPSQGIIVTRLNPLLSFFNSPTESKNISYEVQIDTSPKFNSKELISITNILPKNKYLTEVKLTTDQSLQDKTQYYWRVRTVASSKQTSDWAVSNFYVDTTSDDSNANLLRAPIKNIESSGGYSVKNIIDYDDPGLVSFWQSPPPANSEHWIKFDLGKATKISRLWILSNPADRDGWLKDFVLQHSSNGQDWTDISETKTIDNNSFRNIIDFPTTSARYFRLLVTDCIGYAAQINEVILFTPGKPAIPAVPNSDYVLIIGNEHNGFTFTELAKHIEGLKFNLKTVVIPCYEASLEMLTKLSRQPVAIILSGNNADYPNLPMFEYNGEFEIIRESNIPILGICAGHQFLAMAYGYTRARSMGWADISDLKSKTRMSKIRITKSDKIFTGIKDHFTAPEIHGWAVAEPAPEFEIIASSGYIQAQKSTERLIYGIQFHSEIDVDYNQGKKVLENFINLALKQLKQ